jgi:hypothetical protein
MIEQQLTPMSAQLLFLLINTKSTPSPKALVSPKST